MPSSYRIYLTKSSEVAHLLSGVWSGRNELNTNQKSISRSAGPVNKDCRIPEIFHEQGYFYCIVEYKNGEDWRAPEYELVMA